MKILKLLLKHHVFIVNFETNKIKLQNVTINKRKHYEEYLYFYSDKLVNVIALIMKVIYYNKNVTMPIYNN